MGVLPPQGSGERIDRLPPDRQAFFAPWDYLPLPPSHASEIRLLSPEDARAVERFSWGVIPAGWPEQSAFPHQVWKQVGGAWDEPQLGEVRQWLYRRAVPFNRTVYLLHGLGSDCVVETNWRMIVRYWDVFAWSCGFASVVFDHTGAWALGLHHEEVLAFGSWTSIVD